MRTLSPPGGCSRRPPVACLLSGHLLNVVAQQLVLLWKKKQCEFLEDRGQHRQVGPALFIRAVTKPDHTRNGGVTSDTEP